MSLELAIQELNTTIGNHTLVMKELIAAMKSGAVLPVQKEATQAPKPRTVSGAPPAETIVKAVATTPAASVKADEVQGETKPMTYEELSKVLQNLHTVKGRDALVALLTAFGAKNGKELKEADYPAILVAAKDAMGAA